MVTQEELEKMSPQEIAQLQKQNCIFCKIIGGEIPSSKILENETTIAILDINPARKGHTLIMPKEHYPILPLVPPDVFKSLFVDAKLIAGAVKKKTLAGSTAIFIANGALAGQQSPHFLFHVIPDYKLSQQPKPDMKQGNEALADSLKNNLAIMMGNHAKREGQLPTAPLQPPQHSPQQSPPSPTLQSNAQPKPPSQDELEEKRNQISKIIQENKDVRDLLRDDVSAFKDTIDQHDHLRALFHGVDLYALSTHLKTLPESSAKDGLPEERHFQHDQTQHITSNDTAYAPILEYNGSSSSSSPKPQVFLGENPFEQKERVFDYFESKPKARDLLISDPQKFKELLSKRADVQPLFEDVNIDMLSLRLKEALEGDNQDDDGSRDDREHPSSKRGDSND